MNSKSFAQLLEENAALKLLLEEAHLFGTHSWNCCTVLKIADNCDCWYGKTAEALITWTSPKPNWLVPIVALECKGCNHKGSEHTGRLIGQPRAVCTTCNCPCMGFEPKELLS